MKKFDWLASDSAPNNYPMEIVKGDFILKDGGALYIPDSRTLHKGWGKSESTHVVGEALKALPEKLRISFFSYTENTFYQGEFDLPYERILALFSQGYYSLKNKQQDTYDKITVGVAPGGIVSVWLEGLDKNIQVFYGQAKKADIPWTAILDNPNYTREQFIEKELKETLTPAELQFFHQHGVLLGLWDRYQKQYYWQPRLMTPNRPPKLINKILYVNGERDYLFYPLTSPTAETPRAIPIMFYYSWKTPVGEGVAHHFYFNQSELIPAFEKLQALQTATAESPIYLNIEVQEKAEGRSFVIGLQHGETIIPLTQTHIKQYVSSIGLDNPDSFYQD